MLAALRANRAVRTGGVVSGRDRRGYLHVRRGAAVLVEIQIDGRFCGRHAVHRDSDFAAVRVQERAEIEIVLLLWQSTGS